MKVYFLRHGIAEDREEWSGSDFDRPLTPEGRDRMKLEAKTIAALRLNLDAIITSPLVRAKQTAEIVARAVDQRQALIDDPRLGSSEFGASQFAGIYADYKNANAIMLVGHEPSMSDAIGHLIGGARLTLKKGGVACVDFPIASSLAGTLVWLLPPKVILAS